VVLNPHPKALPGRYRFGSGCSVQVACFALVRRTAWLDLEAAVRTVLWDCKPQSSKLIFQAPPTATRNLNSCCLPSDHCRFWLFFITVAAGVLVAVIPARKASGHGFFHVGGKGHRGRTDISATSGRPRLGQQQAPAPHAPKTLSGLGVSLMKLP